MGIDWAWLRYARLPNISLLSAVVRTRPIPSISLLPYLSSGSSLHLTPPQRDPMQAPSYPSTQQRKTRSQRKQRLPQRNSVNAPIEPSPLQNISRLPTTTRSRESARGVVNGIAAYGRSVCFEEAWGGVGCADETETDVHKSRSGEDITSQGWVDGGKGCSRENLPFWSLRCPSRTLVGTNVVDLLKDEGGYTVAYEDADLGVSHLEGFEGRDDVVDVDAGVVEG
ncbi:hypothetical protein BDP55DRAFT_714008 [Colletotrichum godetiae]|uniref:Uncharacterized protein n=1 Tax=Colletotrichum godetiae TaxID=1209918 RepID=A0AAJ0AQ53_9PEZI|nr:uncharacterized protein BDP55DRAFT_714008 [Colletotrichum godetiae]KAK1687683.1 hypothetical protein BDP55DRAFT_714008 [Colletotrichum godetiae]